MRKKTAIAVAVCVAMSASAQTPAGLEKQFMQAMQESIVRIDGKAHPEQLTFFDRMSHLFNRWHTTQRAALEPLLSASDLAVLDSFAQIHAQLMQSDANRFNPRFDELRLKLSGMTGVEIAQAEMDIEEAIRQLASSRYEATLALMSKEGQAAFRRYAYEHIRPSVGRDNYVAAARAMPDYYKAWVMQAQDRTLPQPPPPATMKREGATTQASDWDEIPPDETGTVGIGTEDNP